MFGKSYPVRPCQHTAQLDAALVEPFAPDVSGTLVIDVPIKIGLFGLGAAFFKSAGYHGGRHGGR